MRVFLHVDQSDAFDYCTLLSSEDQVKNKVCVRTHRRMGVWCCEDSCARQTLSLSHMV